MFGQLCDPGISRLPTAARPLDWRAEGDRLTAHLIGLCADKGPLAPSCRGKEFRHPQSGWRTALTDKVRYIVRNNADPMDAYSMVGRIRVLIRDTFPRAQ